MKESFLSSTSTLDSTSLSAEISTFMLFVWQAPRMFFAGSMACFIGALNTIVISQVVLKPGWNAEAKVCWNTATVIISNTLTLTKFTDRTYIWLHWSVHSYLF